MFVWKDSRVTGAQAKEPFAAGLLSIGGGTRLGPLNVIIKVPLGEYTRSLDSS